MAIKNGHTVYKIWKVNSDVLDRRIHNCINKLSKINLNIPIIIDLIGCRNITSSELSVIGFVVNQTRFHGGDVIIVGANKLVKKLLAMVGFDNNCKYYDEYKGIGGKWA